MHSIRLLCYLGDYSELTGAPRRMLILSQALEKFNIEVILTTVPESVLIKKAKQLGIETIDFPLHSTLTLRNKKLLRGSLFLKIKALMAIVVQNIQFLKVIKSHKPDAIWIRGSKGIAHTGFGGWISRKPIIWDIDFELESSGVIRILHRFGLSCSKAVVLQYHKAGRQIFKHELAGKYRDKCFSLIPGIELSQLQTYKESQRKNSRKNFLMLQVGTICDRKNQALSVEAFHLLLEKGYGDDCMLWFIGELKSDTEIRALVRYYGMEKNVDFLGWRRDIHKLMSDADLLLMPSKDEGVPNVVQEAMYIGLPVIGSEAGGMAEIISDGKTGWILPSDRPDLWAERIIWCRQNQDACSRIAYNASRFASENFDETLWGEKYADIIHDAAGVSE